MKHLRIPRDERQYGRQVETLWGLGLIEAARDQWHPVDGGEKGERALRDGQKWARRRRVPVEVCG